MLISEKTKEGLIKAGIAGGILSVASTVLYGGGSIDIAGMSMPAAVPLFVAGAGSSLVTDLVNNQLNLPSTGAKKLADLTSLAIASGVSGAITTGILKIGVGLSNDSVPLVFALAAGAQAGSEYITVKFLEKDGHLIF